ncbi:MAG TPA: tetratricopeptide repeat protein [Microvirga sp.]|nr:tetratricopeptide repeat protein [Microvirga sp.]
MPFDRYGTELSTDSSEAVCAFEAAVHGVAAHRPSTANALERALRADPNLVAAHALKGFANVILARQELVPVARESHRAASAALKTRGGSVCEHALTDALAHAIGGCFFAAADRIEAYLEESPHTFLAAKLAHALRFMMGDARGMLAITSRVLPHWGESHPGYGFLLGCHAFALEEGADFGGAEQAGRRAVALEPDDAWGLHAVSHVHEMAGRVDEGIAWLESSRPVWKACNNFSFHMAWHLALFYLEREDHEAVLRLYDAEVRPAPTDDFRDVANAVSLLWRLEQDGVAVGHRWAELREIALKRRRDLTLTFAALHHLLTLIAAGEDAAARELAAELAARAASRDGTDQATVMDRVGRDLAMVLLDASRTGPIGRLPLQRLASELRCIGGSHAQRDVFVRTLAGLAADWGDRRSLESILALRRSLKREDRFARETLSRLEAAERRLARRRA